METGKLVYRLSMQALLMVALSACGGSESEPEETEPPIQEQPDPQPDPTPEPEPEPEPDPNPEPEPEPELEVDPELVALPLSTFTLSTSVVNEQLQVTWTGANAESYRVIYWPQNGLLIDKTTTELTVAFSAQEISTGGTIVVEAYDILGNSIFSAPTVVEAL